ncbi:MAG: hypothetical protein ABH871_06545 [Pseudomonadota bacterium]
MKSIINIRVGVVIVVALFIGMLAGCGGGAFQDPDAGDTQSSPVDVGGMSGGDDEASQGGEDKVLDAFAGCPANLLLPKGEHWYGQINPTFVVNSNFFLIDAFMNEPIRDLENGLVRYDNYSYPGKFDGSLAAIIYKLNELIRVSIGTGPLDIQCMAFAISSRNGDFPIFGEDGGEGEGEGEGEEEGDFFAELQTVLTDNSFIVAVAGWNDGTLTGIDNFIQWIVEQIEEGGEQSLSLPPQFAEAVGGPFGFTPNTNYEGCFDIKNPENQTHLLSLCEVNGFLGIVTPPELSKFYAEAMLYPNNVVANSAAGDSCYTDTYTALSPERNAEVLTCIKLHKIDASLPGDLAQVIEEDAPFIVVSPTMAQVGGVFSLDNPLVLGISIQGFENLSGIDGYADVIAYARLDTSKAVRDMLDLNYIMVEGEEEQDVQLLDVIAQYIFQAEEILEQYNAQK